MGALCHSFLQYVLRNGIFYGKAGAETVENVYCTDLPFAGHGIMNYHNYGDGNMSRSSIYRRIRSCENEIESYRSRIRILQDKQANLRALRQKYSNLQNNFGSRQSSRKNSLSNLRATHFNIKMVSPYYAGMSDLLNGSEFNHAYNGLEEAKSKISSSINSLQCEIDSFRNSISGCERTIDCLYDELNDMED